MASISFKNFEKPATFFRAALAISIIGIAGFASSASASWIAITKHDGIPVVSKRQRADHPGLAKRSGVELTTRQDVFAQKFGRYLRSKGESATITSGARSPAHQLAIITSRVRSMDVSYKFPELRRAAPGATLNVASRVGLPSSAPRSGQRTK